MTPPGASPKHVRMTRAILFSALALAACANAPVAVPEAAPAAARAAPEWRAVDPENLILLELATGTAYIELFPEAAPAHAAQIRQLVRDGFMMVKRSVRSKAMSRGPAPSRNCGVPPPFEAERTVSAEGFTLTEIRTCSRRSPAIATALLWGGAMGRSGC